MAIFSSVTYYKIELRGNSPGITAVIECDMADGQLIDIIFLEPNTPLLPNTMAPLYPDYPELVGIWFSEIFVPAEHFTWYLDLLRNETPFVRLDPARPQFNAMHSDWSMAGWGHFD